MLDARRQEVYWQRFRVEADRLVPLVPAVVSAPEDAVHGLDRPCVLIGDGALTYRSRLRERLGADFNIGPVFQHAIRAGVIAFVARERLAQAENDLATLVPEYIRPSYAQEPVDKPNLNR
jgi:tRNA A37 threonylcarbamoyladenosine modification protein TsaB